MRLNNKKVTKLEGDASERKFYRSKNSIIIFSKKNKKKNLHHRLVNFFFIFFGKNYYGVF